MRDFFAEGIFVSDLQMGAFFGCSYFSGVGVVSEGRGGGGVETVADARVLEGFRGTAGNRTRGLSHPKRESYL